MSANPTPPPRARAATHSPSAATPGTALLVATLVVLLATSLCAACGASDTTGDAPGLSPLEAGSVGEGGSASTGGSDAGGDSASTTTTAAPPVLADLSGMTVSYPGDWYAQPDGDAALVIAEHQEDLGAAHPTGARLVLEATEGAATDLTGVLGHIVPSGTDPAAVAGSVSIVEEAAATQVGAEQAVSITLQDDSDGQSTITRYVIVERADGTVYLVKLEAPADQWEAKVAGLEQMLDDVSFPGAGS